MCVYVGVCRDVCTAACRSVCKDFCAGFSVCVCVQECVCAGVCICVRNRTRLEGHGSRWGGRVTLNCRMLSRMGHLPGVPAPALCGAGRRAARRGAGEAVRLLLEDPAASEPHGNIFA